MAARRRYVLPVAAALCAATTLPVWATAGTTAASMKVLHRDLLPAKVLTHSVGAPSATRQWHVGVSVQGRNAAALARLQHAQYDKTSPLYRHFLTPAQYAERYGASATAAKQVRSWLTGKGLHVSYANKAHTYFVATGTVAQVQKTFKVTLRKYVVGTTHFVANTTAPTVGVPDPGEHHAAGSVVGLRAAGQQPRAWREAGRIRLGQPGRRRD